MSVLRQTATHTRSSEQQKLQTAQKYRAVAADSVLRGDMELLEPEAEDAAPRNLYYAPLSFLSQIGSNSQDLAPTSADFFVSRALGAPIPILVNHPRTLCDVGAEN